MNMESAYCAYLIKVGCKELKPPRKKINAPEFRIGRSKEANLCLTDVSVSRNHCVIMCSKDEWSLKNESQLGTIVNGKTIAVNETCNLTSDDLIQLGPQSEFAYKFCLLPNLGEPVLKCARMETCDSEFSYQNTQTSSHDVAVLQNLESEEILLKKQNEDLNSKLEKIAQEKEEIRLKYEDEKNRRESELLCEKNALEQRLKEMEDLLSLKEKEQQALNEKLKQTDKENAKLEILRQEQAIAAEKMIAALRNEVLEKELTMRETLDSEMQKLLDSREQIEENIKIEKEQTEGECAEKVKSLEEELYRVKCDLINATGKRCLLEKELEESEKAKLKETETTLIAKREALSEFSNLIEMELQCSICNELFVKAITLNCTHTVCHHCLQEWKKKKNNCPMCRAPIFTENHSIVLDSFIDKIVENLSEDLKKRRLEMIEERKALEILAVRPSKSKGRKKKGRANPSNVMVVQPTTSHAHSVQTPDVIYIGTAENDAYTVTVDNQQSLASHRYGGYGACFICGQRGHWAGGCPFNVRSNV